MSKKRPDIVLYINGIAVAVMELKKSTVSVADGIRQNVTNQREQFIQRFFFTVFKSNEVLIKSLNRE